MKLILLSGGSGKRLWPLSNDSRSKQFLKLLSDPDGKPESMVQRVWRQLQANGLCGDAYIATGKAQVDIMQSQLGPDVRLITEPERRDTFPAIALAATYLYSLTDTSLDETVAVLPVDPFVEDRFFREIQGLDRVLRESGADLALIGIQPTHPSEKYGYIVPELVGQESPDSLEPAFRSVSLFEEKPQEKRALELIGQKALWNSGVFAFRLGYLIDMLIQKGIPIQYEQLAKQYEQLVKTSFDYEVVEKANRIVCTSYNGYWKDLGTWNTLTEEMGQKQWGRGIMTEDCKGSFLINELDLPVTVLGVPNVIVAVSPDGILVTERDASPRIKELMKHEDQRPMVEERRWGHYRVLDYTRLAPGREVLTKRIAIAAGKNLSYQYHNKRDEIWTVIAGEGELLLDGQLQQIRAGEVVRISRGARHAVKAVSDLEIIEVQNGSELSEDDIVRLSLSWEDIMQLRKP